MGKIEFYLHSGNILKELIKNGVTVGVSSIGSLEPEAMLWKSGWRIIMLGLCYSSNPGPHEVIKEKKPYIWYHTNEVVREILCSKGSCPVY